MSAVSEPFETELADFIKRASEKLPLREIIEILEAAIEVLEDEESGEEEDEEEEET